MSASDDKLFNLVMRSVRQVNQCYKATPEILRKYMRMNYRKAVEHMTDCELTYFLEKVLDKGVCVEYLLSDCGKYWVNGMCAPPDCSPDCMSGPQPYPAPECPAPCPPPCKPAGKKCPPPPCCPPPCPPPPCCPPPCPAPPPCCPPKCPPPCPPACPPKCPPPCPPACPPKCSPPRCGALSFGTPTGSKQNLRRYLPKTSPVLQKKAHQLEQHRIGKQNAARTAKAKNPDQRNMIMRRCSDRVW